MSSEMGCIMITNVIVHTWRQKNHAMNTSLSSSANGWTPRQWNDGLTDCESCAVQHRHWRSTVKCWCSLWFYSWVVATPLDLWPAKINFFDQINFSCDCHFSCDYREDCPDGSDEANCTGQCFSFTKWNRYIYGRNLDGRNINKYI